MPAPETLSGRVAQLEPHLTVLRPGGKGPFTTVVLLHGCGGRKRLMDRWGEVVRDAGAAAVIVDSYAHRRISEYEAYATVCLGLRFWGRERAGDLFAALAWARAQSWCDRSRMIAAGWSHGAWTIMDALALTSGGEMARATGLTDLPDEPLEGLAGVFLNYPYAGAASLSGRRRWRLSPRTIAIVGGRDAIVGREAPWRALTRVRSAGVDIDLHLFETATHAYDEHEAADMRVRYDAGLTARAHDLLKKLIAGA